MNEEEKSRDDNSLEVAYESDASFSEDIEIGDDQNHELQEILEEMSEACQQEKRQEIEGSFDSSESEGILNSSSSKAEENNDLKDFGDSSQSIENDF